MALTPGFSSVDLFNKFPFRIVMGGCLLYFAGVRQIDGTEEGKEMVFHSWRLEAKYVSDRILAEMSVKGMALRPVSNSIVLFGKFPFRIVMCGYLLYSIRVRQIDDI